MQDKYKSQLDMYGLYKAVLEYISDHLESGPSASEVAAEFGYSEKYFVTEFKNHFGVPFGRLVTMMQMRRASAELKHGARVSELAAKYGFASSTQFSRAFKREIGVSPRNFTKTDQPTPEMPLRDSILGEKLFFRYEHMEYIVCYGVPYVMVNGANTNLVRECAFPLTERYRQNQCDIAITNAGKRSNGAAYTSRKDDLTSAAPEIIATSKSVSDSEPLMSAEPARNEIKQREEREVLGFFWGDKPKELNYVVATKTKANVPNEQKFLLPMAHYAVFSISQTGGVRQSML